MVALIYILCLLLKQLHHLLESSKTLEVVYHYSQLRYLQYLWLVTVNKNNTMIKYEDYHEDDVCQRLYLQYYTLLGQL